MNKAEIEAVRWAALTAKTSRMPGTARLLEGMLPAGTAPLCSTCGGHGRYADGNSGTEADGYAPNIVECECAPEERHPESRPRTVTPAPMPGAVGYTVTLRNGVQWPLSAPPAAEPARPRVVPFEQRHCQNGWEACLAGRRDGVVCPDDSCDIDDGTRPAVAPITPAPTCPQCDSYAPYHDLSCPAAREGIIRLARRAHGGAWPEQLESGVMLYEGQRITRAEFEAVK